MAQCAAKMPHFFQNSTLETIGFQEIPSFVRIVSLLLSIALLGFATGSGSAATLGVYTHDYGTAKYVPQGSNTLTADAVVVSEAAATPFFDAFDFTDLAGATIDSLTLTITYNTASPVTFFGFPLKAWRVQIGGDGSGPTGSTFSSLLNDPLSPQSFVLDVSSGATFSNALSSGALGFWFAETALLTTSFNLVSASLTVSGTAATVPLPAPLVLLLSALGGLVLARVRRRKSGLA